MSVFLRRGARALEQASAPSNPAAGSRLLYPKSDGWYEKDSAGVERKVSPAGTKISALPVASALTGTEQIAVVQSGATKVATVSDIRTVDVMHSLVADVTSTSVTPAAVTALDSVLAPGNWLIKIWMAWNTAATTTGIGIHLKATGGAVSRIVATWYTLTTSNATTQTGIADQATAAASFQNMEGRAQRANDVTGNPLAGTDTAAADQFAVLEGIVVVTTQTTLQTMLASEVAGSSAKLLIGTTITCSKAA